MEKSKNKFDTMCVCLQGMGEGPSSPLPTPAACCRLPWPNVRPPPPAQTARHTPLASAAARRHRRMRRAAAARHLRTRLPTSQPPKGPTNQPMNPSIKPAIILLIDPSRKERMNYPIKRSASTADHGEPHYNAHPISCIYPYVHVYGCIIFYCLIAYIYIYIYIYTKTIQLFSRSHHCRPILLSHNSQIRKW
jgi:hypothetical protein